MQEFAKAALGAEATNEEVATVCSGSAAAAVGTELPCGSYLPAWSSFDSEQIEFLPGAESSAVDGAARSPVLAVSLAAALEMMLALESAPAYPAESCHS